MSKMGEEYSKRLEKYAPELLKACKLAKESIKMCDFSWQSEDCLAMLDEIIAKVEKL